MTMLLQNRKRPTLSSLIRKRPGPTPLRKLYLVVRTVAVLGIIVWAGGVDELAETGRQLQTVFTSVLVQAEEASKSDDQQKLKGIH
jgi:hypothetical protein